MGLKWLGSKLMFPECRVVWLLSTFTGWRGRSIRGMMDSFRILWYGKSDSGATLCWWLLNRYYISCSCPLASLWQFGAFSPISVLSQNFHKTLWRASILNFIPVFLLHITQTQVTGEIYNSFSFVDSFNIPLCRTFFSLALILFSMQMFTHKHQHIYRNIHKDNHNSSANTDPVFLSAQYNVFPNTLIH